MVLAARVEAAAHLDAQPADYLVQLVALGQQALAQFAGQAARGGDAQLAGVGAGAGGNVDDGAGAGCRKLRRLQVFMQRRQVVGAHPAQHQVLFHRGSHRFLDVLARHVGHRAHLRRGDVAQRQRDGHRGVARLALCVDVGAQPLGVLVAAASRGCQVDLAGLPQRQFLERLRLLQVGGPARVVVELGAFLPHQPLELLEAQLGDQELDARRGPVALLAQARVYPRDRLRDRQQLVRCQEVGEQLGLMRHRAEPAADVQLEAAPGLAVHLAGHRHGAQVVHPHQPAGLVAAAGEGDLELAPEVLHVGMAEQEVGQRPRVGGDVEGLGMAHAGHRAGGDVAHRVAARLAGGDADRGQPPHQVGGVHHVDEVELDVLARGDVADAVGVFFSKIGQDLDLFRVQPAPGDLDALHAGGVPGRVRPLGQLPGRIRQLLGLQPVVAMAVVVALAVDAAPQARLREHAILDPTLPLQRDLVLEHVDLGAEIAGDAVAEAFFPQPVACLHKRLIRSRNPRCASTRWRSPRSRPPDSFAPRR